MSSSSPRSGVQIVEELVRLRRADALVKGLVAHHHRRRVTTGEALAELDGETPVCGRLQAASGGIQAQTLTEITVKFVRTGECTTQREGMYKFLSYASDY